MAGMSEDVLRRRGWLGCDLGQYRRSPASGWRSFARAIRCWAWRAGPAPWPGPARHATRDSGHQLTRASAWGYATMPG